MLLDNSLSPSWKDIINIEQKKEYFQKIYDQLEIDKKNGVTIYPKEENIFQAFALTPFESIKIVILGQDPYHGPNQAHGLSFSVEKGQKFPPSLRNIFKELSADLMIDTPAHGNLEHWAKQGILLLNATLSVQAGKPNSHAKIGWQTFTDTIIQKISQEHENIIFLLWGDFAIKKEKLIDGHKHFILKSPHPSPFSAHKGFFGSKVFSKTNDILKKIGKPPIKWET